MNWRKIKRRELNDYAKHKGLNHTEKKNLFEAFKFIKKEKYEGLFEVVCQCKCEKQHTMTMIIKDVKSIVIGAKKQNDLPLTVMCDDCKNKIIKYSQHGLEQNMIMQLLGWKGDERWDAVNQPR